MTTFTHCFWFLSYLSTSEIEWGKNGVKAPFNATMVDYLKRGILTHLKNFLFKDCLGGRWNYSGRDVWGTDVMYKKKGIEKLV